MGKYCIKHNAQRHDGTSQAKAAIENEWTASTLNFKQGQRTCLIVVGAKKLHQFHTYRLSFNGKRHLHTKMVEGQACIKASRRWIQCRQQNQARTLSSACRAHMIFQCLTGLPAPTKLNVFIRVKGSKKCSEGWLVKSKYYNSVWIQLNQ